MTLASPPHHRRIPLLLIGLVFTMAASAQDAVNVTVTVEDSTLILGESTTVTFYGQIDASIEAQADGIFNWYIDVLNSNGGVAAGYDAFMMPASDNTPSTSGEGTPEGANLRGIHNTFLFATPSEAGNGSPVILAQFDVMAWAPGTTTFSAAAGTTLGLSTDFHVLMTVGGSFTGGNYSLAAVDITVSDELPPSLLGLAVEVVGDQATVTFTPLSGFDHTVQWSPTLQGGSWSDLPAGPHNTGTVVDDVTGVGERFYRVLVAAP